MPTANTDSIISIKNLHKTYKGGFSALKNINLEIKQGEIFALLGPNGAGKTTLINSVCGVLATTSGTITVGGKDINADYRHVRKQIGLVPQELATDMFEKVINVVNFSRGLFGNAPSAEHAEKILKSLSLWDKKDNRIMTLSGGMKRRVMMAKALAHDPTVLFLDEPTAGVDVSLRKDMWNLVRDLRKSGVTIILTTHYIEEAQEMADRIGIINKGEIILVEEKAKLMKKLGKKQIIFSLSNSLKALPADLGAGLALSDDGTHLTYTFETANEDSGIEALVKRLSERKIDFKDLQSKESTLEEIFVGLVSNK